MRPSYRRCHSRCATTVPFWRALLLTVFLLPGCSGNPAREAPDASALLHDDAFPGSSAFHVETAAEIFALNADARDWMDTHINSIRDMDRRRDALIDAIFDKTALDITYENAANTVASDTFRRQSANCLSLTILTYAMAEYAGFDAKFQEVDTHEYWERRGGYNLNSGHVNLRIGSPVPGISTMTLSKTEIEVDFQRPRGPRPPTRVIAQNRVLAMFYNNKAVDALLKNNDDAAYAYLKAALSQDPEFDMAMTNLGLLYGRNNHPQWAETGFRHALRTNRSNAVAGMNLAALLDMTGRHEEAASITERLDRRLQDNPYYAYVKGQAAYDAGNLHDALRFFRKSVALNPRVDQFHFGLARTYYRLGDRDQAETSLRHAEQYARDDGSRKRYHGKLEAMSGL